MRRTLALFFAAAVAATLSLGAMHWIGNAQTATGSAPVAQRPVHRAAPARIAAVRHQLRRGTAATRRAATGTATSRTAAGGASRRRQNADAPASAATATPSGPPLLLQSFQGTAQSAAITALGSDQEIAPPDPDVAVGSSSVVEVTNSAIQFFNRAGTSTGITDINKFVSVPSSWTTTDPQVAYDPQSGRFYFSVLEFDTGGGNGNQVVLLASNSSDPSTGWHGLVLPNVAPNCTDPSLTCNGSLPPFADQPWLGFSDNVVAVAWNYFNGPSLSAPWYGSQIDIVQKSDLISNTLTLNTVAPFFNGPFAPRPVVSLSPTAVQYVVYNNSDPIEVGNADTIGVLPIAGQPEQQNVNPPTEVDAGPYNATSGPTSEGGTMPPAPQKGSSVLLDTGDDRLTTAVWQNGTLWTAGNTGATAANLCPSATSCLNLVSVPADASGNVNATGARQLVLGVSGSFLYYPAISVDSNGDGFLVYDASSSSTFESVMGAGLIGGQVTAPVTLHASTAAFDPGGGVCNGNSSPCRWGDYSGAAQDPSHPSDVWVVSESDDGNTSAQCTSNASCWNSFIGRYTYGAPAISNLAPSAGPVAGGQTVVVNGSDFASGSTVTFAGSPITPSAFTADSFQFTTPAHAAGLVSLTVTDPVGTASTGYIYTALGSYVPLTPFRIMDTRTGLCGGGTCHNLGPAQSLKLQVAGYTDPATNETVPATATAAVLNVTAASGSADSLFTVWPDGSAQPLASNLNFNASTNTANLVTALLGQGGAVDVFNAVGTAGVVADVEGYFAPQAASNPLGEFHPIPPLRVCDSRAGQPANPCNGNGAAPGDSVLGPGQSAKVNVTQVTATSGDVPADGTAAAGAFNLTAVLASQPTYLSLFPTSADGTCAYGSGKPAPPISTINLNAGTQANRVFVQLGPDATGGKNTDVCVYNSVGSINFIIDANGWFGSSTAATATQYQATGPSRICDTRPASGEPCQSSTLAANATLSVAVAGVGGAPAMSAANPPVAIIGNLTAVLGSSDTFLALYPADATLPNASDLNIRAGHILPNLVVVKLAAKGSSSAGSVDLYNSVGHVDAILDLEGWFQ